MIASYEPGGRDGFERLKESPLEHQDPGRTVHFNDDSDLKSEELSLLEREENLADEALFELDIDSQALQPGKQIIGQEIGVTVDDIGYIQEEELLNKIFQICNASEIIAMEKEIAMLKTSDIDQWFKESEITIGEAAVTSEQQTLAQQMFYTWKEFFVYRLRDIKSTDLIEHAINTKADAAPVRARPKRYTQQEQEYSAIIFPDMEEAGILVQGSSKWGAITLFPPKKKGSKDLRIVHNFIPIN
ncbi:MAG: hypothetical protein M1839_004611 [Geoglossum umbratile]|nr:MAG: hypothetical protein M1839_004611 [Geoglossum umbratile]